MPFGDLSAAPSDSIVKEFYGENNVNAGPLRALPEVSVDHFHGASLKATAFFLTHAHTDHMVGLEGSSFLKRLGEDGVHLYCNGITPILLRGFNTPYLGGIDHIMSLMKRRKIVPMDTNKPEKIRVPMTDSKGRIKVTGQSYELEVTLLSAEHCPGSVMYLFERKDSGLRILHTGDFRLDKAKIMNMLCLHETETTRRKNGHLPLKKIHQLYIDTTFATLEFEKTFPCRMEVVSRAITEISNWIKRSDRHWVLMKFAAKFSHEYMLVQLFETLNMRIHVSGQRSKVYEDMKEVGIFRTVTTDKYQTRLHFCDNRRCVDDGEFRLEVKLSTMWYALQSGGEEQLVGKSNRTNTIIRRGNRLNVCYSMHPSLQEVVDVIDYIQPEIVTPLVRPFHSDLCDVRDAFEIKCHHSFLFEDYRGGKAYISGGGGKRNKRRKTDIPIEEKFSLLSTKWQEDMDPDNPSDDEDDDKNDKLLDSDSDFSQPWDPFPSTSAGDEVVPIVTLEQGVNNVPEAQNENISINSNNSSVNGSSQIVCHTDKNITNVPEVITIFNSSAEDTDFEDD